MEFKSRRNSSKRDRDENTPVQSKRRRPVSVEATSPLEETQVWNSHRNLNLGWVRCWPTPDFIAVNKVSGIVEKLWYLSIYDSFLQKCLKPKLHRCHSESEAMIKSALNRIADEPDLIGDCSKVSMGFVSSSNVSEMLVHCCFLKVKDFIVSCLNQCFGFIFTVLLALTLTSEVSFFQPYCLPTIPGKHSDLKAISSETVSVF